MRPTRQMYMEVGESCPTRTWLQQRPRPALPEDSSLNTGGYMKESLEFIADTISQETVSIRRASYTFRENSDTHYLLYTLLMANPGKYRLEVDSDFGNPYGHVRWLISEIIK